jgi:hypothetical protein
MNQEWLEWFVGFIDRRGRYHSQYHTNALKLGMSDKDFIFYLKILLNLNSSPFGRSNVGSQINIGSLQYLELLFSILHSNIITTTFNFEYDLIFNNKFGNFNNEDSKPPPSLNNGWLAGFIDANSYFYFVESIPVISNTLKANNDLMRLVSELFTKHSVSNKGKHLKFKGLKF